MRAPGRADEDERGGFALGGWAVPTNDEVMGRVTGEGMSREGAVLLGRRTYRLMIHPLVLGTGRSMFADAARSRAAARDSVTTTTGGLIATYRPA